MPTTHPDPPPITVTVNPLTEPPDDFCRYWLGDDAGYCWTPADGDVFCDWHLDRLQLGITDDTYRPEAVTA